jgi:hypothetical protein
MVSLNETQLVLLGFGNMIVIALTTLGYAIGGRSNKWIRRWVSPAIFVAWCYAVQRTAGTGSWLTLASYPLYVASWSMGYGDGSRLRLWVRSKFVVRLVCGMAYGLAAAPILHGAIGSVWVAWLLWCWTAAFLVAYLGTENPVPAAWEETLICAVTILPVPFFCLS